MTQSLLTLILAAALPSAELTTLDGTHVEGMLTRIADDLVTIRVDGKDTAIPFSKLAALELTGSEKPPKEPSFPQAAFEHGSVAVADNCLLDEGALNWSVGSTTRSAPQTAVRRIQFLPIPEPLLPEWSPLLDEPRQDDMLIVVRDGRLEYHRGTVRRITAQRIHFEINGEVIPVRREPVTAVLLRASAKPSAVGALCRLVETDGSSWMVRNLTAENGQIEWTALAGPSFAASYDDIARIDFARTQTIPLKELARVESVWTPYLAREKQDVRFDFFAPRFDRGFYSPVPVLDGRSRENSLSLHARSLVTWRVPEGSRRFVATVGIDDAVRPGGNAVVQISADGAEVLKKTVTGRTAAEEIRVDLTGVRRLTILVDYGEGMDIGDTVVFADARIVQ